MERDGLCLNDIGEEPESIILNGLKYIDCNGVRTASSHFTTDTPELVDVESILSIAQAERVARGCYMWVFTVVDPVHTTSEVYIIPPDGKIKKNIYNHVVSRSRELVPLIGSVISGYKNDERT